MSLLQLGRTCYKHPQERVVGVCSACLAQKLTSLYTHPASALAGSTDPHLQLGGSPLSKSPPESTNSPPRLTNLPAIDLEHLQTIDEEDDSPSEVISHEGLNDKSLEASTSVGDDNASVCPLSNTAQLTRRHHHHHQEIPSSSQEDSSVDKKASIGNQEKSLISVQQLINKEISWHQEEETPPAGLDIHARNPAKCRRSKSLSVLGAESLKHVERTSSQGEELAASFCVQKASDASAGVKKVTLRALFQLDDAEKQRIRAFEPTHADNVARVSECNRKEEEFSRDSNEDEKKINEEQDVGETPHNHIHSSRCCVPSTSSLSSSVCPPVPAKIRESVLLNSLLCRKRRDGDNGSVRKPSRMHEAKRKSVNEDGCMQAIDDGGFIRATYIASESRSQSMRRCKSKVELFPTRSSFSCSEPTSPGCISHVDSRSECKYNFAARALAIDIPSIFQASIGPEEVVTTAAESVEPGGEEEQSREATRLSMDWTVSQSRIQMLACEGECGVATEIQPISKVREVQEREEEGKLLPTPVFSETLASNTEISSISNRTSSAEEVESRNAMETELVEVCQRVIGSHQRRPYGECTHVMVTSPSASYAAAMEKCSEGEEASIEHWRREKGIAGEEGATEECRKGFAEYARAGEQGTTRGQRAGQGGEAEEGEVGETGATENWVTGQEGGTEDMEAGEDGVTEYRRRAGEAGGGTEYGGAGEDAERAEHEYERSVSCKTAGAQQQHASWEPYCKSGKSAGTSSRTSCRWPASSRTVRVAPDHPLLRFYLTPLRSSGRTRSRHYRSPKRHFWSLIFA